MQKRYSGALFILLFLLLSTVLLIVFTKQFLVKSDSVKPDVTTPLSSSPTPFLFTSYTPPRIEKKEVYTVVMIGDSMTAALGPHGGSLSDMMNTLYKKQSTSPQRIIINNYAVSSNILSVNNQLTRSVTINEYTLEPLLSKDFDLILVESFGYNPLSEFGIEDGIKKQTNALDDLMKTLITTHPESVIVFVATIAPDIETYARKTQPKTSVENRAKLAQERISYIKNHIVYAQEHAIPLVNIYEKSLTADGDGNRRYVNATDDIHPSFEGIEFISREIADVIYTSDILPK